MPWGSSLVYRVTSASVSIVHGNPVCHVDWARLCPLPCLPGPIKCMLADLFLYFSLLVALVQIFSLNAVSFLFNLNKNHENYCTLLSWIILYTILGNQLEFCLLIIHLIEKDRLVCCKMCLFVTGFMAHTCCQGEWTVSTEELVQWGFGVHSPCQGQRSGRLACLLQLWLPPSRL